MGIVEKICAWAPGMSFGGWFLSLSYGWQFTVALALLALTVAMIEGIRYGLALCWWWLLSLIQGVPMEVYDADFHELEDERYWDWVRS